MKKIAMCFWKLKSHLLFVSGEVVKFTSGVSHAFSAFFLSEDANALADSLGSVLVVTSDHDNPLENNVKIPFKDNIKISFRT